MAPSRRQSNGRSPLVNQKCQITAFFNKASPNQSQSPSTSKPNPNPSPSQLSNPNSKTSPSRSPTPSPTTSSAFKPKISKPSLTIGSIPSLSTPTSPKGTYGEEVVDNRVRVYWPLDEEWYEGCIKSFDKRSGKHLVQYDDADEELLDLSMEKFEWMEGSVKKFRRLRRVLVIEEEKENVDGNESARSDSSGDNWEENVGSESVEDYSEHIELENEEEQEMDILKRMKWVNVGRGKRKVNKRVGDKVNSSKKWKSDGAVDGDGNDLVETTDNSQTKPWEFDWKPCAVVDNIIKSDGLERFGCREAEKFPFLGKDRRDAQRRCPGDMNYDPRTLFLPHNFLKGLSSCQRQWWEFKSRNMDKVLFFKMGKFYELFEMDAHVGVKELDLQYMKGEQPHCGFPEKNFSVNVEKLARKGYRVLVVEQTETPEQLQLRRREEGSKDKVVKREICAMVSKGTLTEGEMLSTNPDASYIMAMTESCLVSSDQMEERIYGVCVVDVSTSRIIIGQINDDMECSALCCLLSELRPVEIIKPAKLLSLNSEKLLSRYARNPLVNELVPGLEFWDADKTVCEVKSFYSRTCDQLVSSLSDQGNMKATKFDVDDGLCCLPEVLNELVNAGDGSRLALSALGGTLFYLRQAFLDETLLRYAKFELLPCSGFKDAFQKPYMVLDAVALENLEIFENNRNGDSTGTLYAQLNHCVTAFGKRLLKTWLARPLYHSGSIKARQDAIAGLRGNNLSYSINFQKELSKLPDMERLLMRLFARSEANGRNANKIVLYEDAAKKQLQEFISTMRGCEKMAQACSQLGSVINNVNSGPLHHLLIPGKGLPDTSLVLKHFRDAFDWAEANDSGRIIPCEGVDTEYDSACENIKMIESSMKRYLKEQRKLLGDTSILYVTVGKESYLLEVPESLSSSVPREYELRSSKKGFFRYWTPDIKKMLAELSHAESEKESKLKGILQRLIGRFCEHHRMWRRLISTVAELDVLISLAVASDYYEGPTCRPIISDNSSPNGMRHLTAKGLGHPVLRSDSLGKGTFVPNDIMIGGPDHARFILLSGPNMGGKSTLLRQVCLAVILAQVGADVPAEHFELSLIDRIFVRMGAKDHIMAGQSTFLTELSETASMLAFATCDSLVALDELGRGTSTSDGQAIAESVLDFLVHNVQCRGMFSTHYHRLAVDFEGDSKVSLCHMACQVGKAVGEIEEVTFLYKLTPGTCPKSYGVNVARLAGIPDSVLCKAVVKSKEFEAAYGGVREVSHNRCQGQDERVFALIQNLLSVASNLTPHKTSQKTGIATLIKLQQRAQILLNKHMV
ncbi:hypothetical protein Nepgr_004153 [Nepenthes gracilis]|uniref:DNA mismatch repair protein n=1 Tax=Nepenthes gracilis TaxID=150966 RepID=A0AAD3S0W6_NEPGR|nr:hypothetical protein Nepgr_004153 [Nepenthes gracilis]